MSAKSPLEGSLETIRAAGRSAESLRNAASWLLESMNTTTALSQRHQNMFEVFYSVPDTIEQSRDQLVSERLHFGYGIDLGARLSGVSLAGFVTNAGVPSTSSTSETERRELRVVSHDTGAGNCRIDVVEINAIYLKERQDGIKNAEKAFRTPQNSAVFSLDLDGSISVPGLPEDQLSIPIATKIVDVINSLEPILPKYR